MAHTYETLINVPGQTLREYAINAYSALGAALSAHRYSVAETWENISTAKQRAYKFGSFLTSAAGLTVALQSIRMTGAAAHEITTITDSLSASSAPIHMHNTLSYTATDPLPANLDDAPDPVPLGTWNPRTGDGTIWDQAVDYAESLGYSKLTQHQKWELTDNILQTNGLSWDEAQHLSVNYQPDMPTQRTMVEELQDLGARRTHTPDRIDTDSNNTGDADSLDTTTTPHTEHPETTTTNPGIDNNNNGVPDAAETLQVPPEVYNSWDKFQFWLHTQWDDIRTFDSTFPAWMDRNWLTAAQLGFILVGTKMAQNWHNHGYWQSYGYGDPDRRWTGSSATVTSAPGQPQTGPVATPVKQQEKRPLLKKITAFGGLLLARRLWENHKKKQPAKKAHQTAPVSPH